MTFVLVSGAVAVHLRQHYKGIPIFQAAQTVRFAPNGTLQDTTGSSVTLNQELAASPTLSVQEAVLRAAQYVAVPGPDELGAKDQFGEPMNPSQVSLTGFQPKVIAIFPDKPESPTVLEAGPFGDQIKASLVWFPLAMDDLRLTWKLSWLCPTIRANISYWWTPRRVRCWNCYQLMQTVAAQGNVYRIDGGTPRQMTAFPLPLPTYNRPIPGDLPPGFPDTLVAVDSTVGNSTNARSGDTGPPVRGTVQGGLLTFNPNDPVGDDQKVVNIFYYCCYMHDYFYLLGFRQANRNFQQDNFGRGGLPGDPVDARSFSAAVFGTASMSRTIDGDSSPVMRMGLVTSTNRHTAFDSSVVFHELMHGVTNRLVGGGGLTNLADPQSSGMGEGWSDFDACTINNSTVRAWVVNQPGGIRGFPYDSNFPDHFGMLGTGRYNEEHNIGEIWCATLMEMTRNIGTNLSVQLVLDALSLTPSNPSFLDARDAIVRAVGHKHSVGQLNFGAYLTARRGIWAAFAKFGMGPDARSNGAQLSGIVADFNVPGRLEIFVRGGDGHVWHLYQTSPNGDWSEWEDLSVYRPLGASIVGEPGVGSAADGRLEIFVPGSDGHVWHLYQTSPNGDWSEWEDLSVYRPLGASIVGEPGVGSAADGRLEIFVPGSDGHVWHLYQTSPNGDWSEWEDLSVYRPLGASIVGEPGVGSAADGRLEIFVPGSDGHVWHLYQHRRTATGPNGRTSACTGRSASVSRASQGLAARPTADWRSLSPAAMATSGTCTKHRRTATGPNGRTSACTGRSASVSRASQGLAARPTADWRSLSPAAMATSGTCIKRRPTATGPNGRTSACTGRSASVSRASQGLAARPTADWRSLSPAAMATSGTCIKRRPTATGPNGRTSACTGRSASASWASQLWARREGTPESEWQSRARLSDGGWLATNVERLQQRVRRVTHGQRALPPSITATDAGAGSGRVQACGLQPH